MALIVLAPAIRIAQHIIGLGDFLEALFGVDFIFVDVGVIFARKPAESLFNLLLRGFAVEAQDFIVVFLDHRQGYLRALAYLMNLGGAA